jgi:hypothetical protein
MNEGGFQRLGIFTLGLLKLELMHSKDSSEGQTHTDAKNLNQRWQGSNAVPPHDKQNHWYFNVICKLYHF